MRVDPAVVRSFVYAEPGDPYAPKAIADMRRALTKVEGLGSIRVREGERVGRVGSGGLGVVAHRRPA